MSANSNWRSPWTWAGILAGVLYLALRMGPEDSLIGRLVLKPIPVALMVGWVLRGPRDRYGVGVATGLLFAMAGDIVLEFEGSTPFLAGLALNLIAHIAYIIAFGGGHPPLALRRAFVFFLPVGVLLGSLYEGLGQMAAPVLAYGTAISAMMWRASARIGMQGQSSRGAWLATLGAIGFAICDSLIALNRFGSPIQGVALPIMLAYWFGQWGIAASARNR
jgi:alkenylglycerophosphocholine/alkenylglycerophosphoethanolamine hydrolase